MKLKDIARYDKRERCGICLETIHKKDLRYLIHGSDRCIDRFPYMCKTCWDKLSTSILKL